MLLSGVGWWSLAGVELVWSQCLECTNAEQKKSQAAYAHVMLSGHLHVIISGRTDTNTDTHTHTRSRSISQRADELV